MKENIERKNPEHRNYTRLCELSDSELFVRLNYPNFVNFKSENVSNFRITWKLKSI